jgi:membrane protein implicated in regulation of membrane protease activity
MEGSRAIQAILIGIAISIVGLGMVYGLQLYSWFEAGCPEIRGCYMWVHFIGDWLIALGAFLLVMALLGLLVRRLRRGRLRRPL